VVCFPFLHFWVGWGLGLGGGFVQQWDIEWGAREELLVKLVGET